jgi:hypothetical protein
MPLRDAEMPLRYAEKLPRFAKEPVYEPLTGYRVSSNQLTIL